MKKLYYQGFERKQGDESDRFLVNEATLFSFTDEEDKTIEIEVADHNLAWLYFLLRQRYESR